ncbi:MAG: hypothetical protein COV71_01690 [Candidatus Omnitrophica bacterium CG11_big_fil_rev_8_21_14_0_20_41_12]|nr:MAG: hypothetical protein COV71_01690 [Candidatus Omnitrophica bacterium CG11_big_fil_rev_8_21_14_0_20_41_12]
MEIKKITHNIRKDLSHVISLVGVIPLLVFNYILIGKIANYNVLAGQVGYIITITIGVFIMGIIVGKRMLMSVTLKLIDDNQKILTMQHELIEKNRLAAITETVLALGDQVNNPLLSVTGNLDLLELEIRHLELSEKTRNRIETMRNNFSRIREVTDKMSRLHKVEMVTIQDNTRMVDLNKSE